MTDQKITRATPPSVKAQIRSDEEARAKARAHEKETRLANAFGVTFSTPEGVIVLEWIRKQCLHNELALGREGGHFKIDPQITVYRAMQQALYLEIRRYIPKRVLMEVEYAADKN
jgi:hypothetical protein